MAHEAPASNSAKLISWSCMIFVRKNGVQESPQPLFPNSSNVLTCFVIKKDLQTVGLKHGNQEEKLQLVHQDHCPRFHVHLPPWFQIFYSQLPILQQLPPTSKILQANFSFCSQRAEERRSLQRGAQLTAPQVQLLAANATLQEGHAAKAVAEQLWDAQLKQGRGHQVQSLLVCSPGKGFGRSWK